MWNFNDRYNAEPRDFQELVSIFLFKASLGIRFWLNCMNLTPMEEYNSFVKDWLQFRASVDGLKLLINGRMLNDEQYDEIVNYAVNVGAAQEFSFLIERRSFTDERYLGLAQRIIEQNNQGCFYHLLSHKQFSDEIKAEAVQFIALGTEDWFLPLPENFSLFRDSAGGLILQILGASDEASDFSDTE